MSELLPMNGTVLAARQPRMTETALELAPDLTAAEWEAIGHELGRFERASAWWIGDWINYGEDAGYVSRDKYAAAEQLTGLKKATLWDYAWVARTYESSYRHEELSFKHHHAVAPRPQRERVALLNEAVENEWSAAELRQHRPVTRPGQRKDRHGLVIETAASLAKVGANWDRAMTDTLAPPQARKQLTVLRKAHDLLGEVIEAVEYRADTLATFRR